MINVLKIFKKEYQTLNKIEISKKNLLSNYRYLSSLNRRVKIAPVIKSNAYGHGLIPIAKILETTQKPFENKLVFEGFKKVTAFLETFINKIP